MLTDESLLLDVLRHPVCRGGGKEEFSSLSSSEISRLKKANRLLRSVCRDRQTNSLYKHVASANLTHNKDLRLIQAVCTPEILSRLSRGALQPDQVILDCTYTINSYLPS